MTMKPSKPRFERDNFMSAQDAKDWGLIDEILESRSASEDEK